MTWAKVETGVRSGFWRSVGASQNVFFLESFIDELAHLAGQDAVDYRRALLADSPRELAVLDAAASAAGWGKPLSPGRGRGVALVSMSDTVGAQVVEIAVGEDGRIDLRRVVCALDCGTVANPDAVRAQAEGGIVWGLAAAFNAISLKDGVVEQGNFDTHVLPVLGRMPRIDIHLVGAGTIIGGAGEETVPLERLPWRTPFSPQPASACRSSRLPRAGTSFSWSDTTVPAGRALKAIRKRTSSDLVSQEGGAQGSRRSRIETFQSLLATRRTPDLLCCSVIVAAGCRIRSRS